MTTVRHNNKAESVEVKADRRPIFFLVKNQRESLI